MTRDEMRDIVRATVRETLVELGLDVRRPLEVQADMRALREWRLAFHAMRKTALIAIVGAALSGTVAAFWIGFKSFLK